MKALYQKDHFIIIGKKDIIFLLFLVEMVSKEIQRTVSLPAEIYQTKIAEFGKEKEKILVAPQTEISLTPFKTLWEKLSSLGKVTPKPITLSPEIQLPSLETRFNSWLFSDRKLVVCHLLANPSCEEEIITNYLQSKELLHDPNTFGQFLVYWFSEYFQQVDSGPTENLLNHIKTTAPDSLPHDLQKARKDIFGPLLKLLNSQEEELFRKKVKRFGFWRICQDLAQAILASEKSFPPSLLREYQNYVAQLVKLEAGIIKPEPNVPEPKPAKTQAQKLPPPPAIPVKPIFPSENPPPAEIPYSFSVVLGQDSEKSMPVPDLDTLKNLIETRKIKGLGPLTAENIWNHLSGFSQMTPIQIRKRYGERVAGGPFEDWRKIPLGRKWLILFEIENNRVFFRVGPHEDIYATSRRNPPDRARRL